MKLLLIDSNSAMKNTLLQKFDLQDIDLVCLSSQQVFNRPLNPRHHQYDSILLGNQECKSDNVELLRHLKTERMAAPIVVIAESQEPDDTLELIEAGAQDVLSLKQLSLTQVKRNILQYKQQYQLEEMVAESHRHLKFLAENDNLTGLRNRFYFQQSLRDAIELAQRNNKHLAVIFLDLDFFKHINDTLGHPTGDQFLCAVAQRLNHPIRSGDKLCRLGGDEFAILAHNLDKIEQVYLLVNRLFGCLKEPVLLHDKLLDIRASFGVATYPDCAREANELMKCADIAMYRAKSLGRNQVQYYSKEFHKKMSARIKLESDLKLAVQRGELCLHYQPQLDAQSHLLLGFEALVRWQHPEMGLIPPDQFISVAEEINMINEIGHWVIEEACHQWQRWSAQFNFSQPLTMAINLSAKQLSDSMLIAHLKTCLSRYGIAKEALEVELTESCIDQSPEALATLNNIAQLGITLAIDDFGTGYSSFTRLKQTQIKVIKIDKSFVQDIQSPRDQRMLTAICEFSKALDYKIVAEGIETQEQQQTCALLGVDRMQGFYFSRPVTARDIELIWLS